MQKKTISKSPRREATENAMLDAFEQVLIEDGLRRLSVNAVVERAGVGKPLLYRYFTDLSGLVRSWGARRGFWPAGNDAENMPSAQAKSEREFRRRFTEELISTAEHLRANPVTLEFLAEELTAQSELSDAFAQARSEYGRPYLRKMLQDSRYTDPENRGLIIIISAAVTYLAMRSRRSPSFMGLRLDTERGWNEAMDMVRNIAERGR